MIQNEQQSDERKGSTDDHTLAPESEAGLRRKEVVIGGVFLVTLFAVIFGLNYVQGSPVFSQEYEILARFDEAGGIQEGAPVTMSGVRVGEVEGVQLSPRRRGAVVRLELREEYVVPEGSTASISGLAALDNVVVAIDRGPLDSPALQEGDTIPTEKQAGLEAMTEGADTALASAARTLSEIGGLVSETRGDLTATAGNLRAATEQARRLIAQEQDEIRSTIHTVNELGNRLGELTRELESLSGRGGDTLVATLSDIHRVTVRLDTTLVSLRASGEHLESILAAVESGEGTVGRLVYDPSLYDRLDSLALHMDDLIVDLKEQPGRYLSKLNVFSLF